MQNKYHFALACGGTGGHLTPGIALAQMLQSQGHKASLLVSNKQIDQEFIELYPDMRFLWIPGHPPSRRLKSMMSCFTKTGTCVYKSSRFLRKERVNAIVGFGGFTSFGVGIASKLLGRPLALHEANQVAGRSIRLLSRFAQRVYLPEGASRKGIAVQNSQIRRMGYPLRQSICRMDCKVARRKLEFEEGGRLLVVLGGSQGSRSLNHWVDRHAQRLNEEGVNVCCITGPQLRKPTVIKRLDCERKPVETRYIAFTDAIGVVLSAADLVVARAGAGTIAELAHCKVPSILVPYPYASDQHQLANARAFEAKGCCFVIEETELEKLYPRVRHLIFKPSLLEDYREHMKAKGTNLSAYELAMDLENWMESLSVRQKLGFPDGAIHED